MKNIFEENRKLIGDIARKYGCDLGVAKDRLKADLISGGDGETGGLIPAELHVQANAIGRERILQMNAEYFEQMKETQGFGKAFDASDYQ